MFQLPRALQPLQRFLQTEAAGGILLFVGAVLALIWANLAPESYDRLWDAHPFGLPLDARHVINDAAMAIFFLVVGLEIKRELRTGELRDPRVAALPVAAAIGGMVVPALVFTAIAGGTEGGRGWGIPMATDIAFALGVLTLVGKRLAPGAKLFLLTLAIIDDLGAILVIAISYSDEIDLVPLGVGAAILGAMVALRSKRVRLPGLQLALAVATWFAIYRSGVHATIAGVLVAMTVPVTDRRRTRPLEELEQRLHPWTSFVVVPVFALANAGVRFGGISLDDPAAVVIAAIVAGLVLGKLAGIMLGAWIAVRVGVARLPEGTGWSHLAGVAALGGIGLTVSLFIASLAFGDGDLLATAKLGVLAASALAGLIGAAILAATGDRLPQERERGR